MTDLIGQSLGRYHILEQLGEGGMATVYKAYDTRLERHVAIKVILTQKQSTEKFLKRFEREARSLAQLTHPNIVGIIDYGEQDGMPYLVMEYVPSGTLKHRLGKPIPYQEAARMLAPIARALAYAHQQKIIHRDIKPANILITQSGEPMLSDFGIAKILEAEETVELTGTGVGVGTPEYMSPEQAQGKLVDARSDIYSLGVVLFEMVTGRKPFQADTPMAVVWKLASEPLPRPRQFVSDLPEAVEGVLLKALAKNPNDRYSDMNMFAGVLEGLASSQLKAAKASLIQKTPVPKIPFQSGEKPRNRKWLPPVIAIVFLVTVIIAGVTIVQLEQQGSGLLPGAATKTPALTSTQITILPSASTSTLLTMGQKTATSIPSETSVSDIIDGTYCDSFDGSVLGSNWIWVNPSGDATYSLSDHPGYLKLTVSGKGHDLYQNINAPRLIQKVSGDFKATTLVNISPTANYQGAGLLLWQNDGNFVRLERTLVDGIDLLYKVNGQYSAIQIPYTQPKVYLKLELIGNIIYPSYSANNVSWISIDKIEILNFQENYIGVDLVNEWQDNKISADFDYFCLYPSTQTKLSVTIYALPSDGEVLYRWCKNDWATCRNAAQGNATWVGLNVTTIGAGFDTKSYTIERGFLSFDTTSIPANATINSATLHFFTGAYLNGNTTIHVVHSFANASLSNNDYGRFENKSGGSIKPSSSFTWFEIGIQVEALSWIKPGEIASLALINDFDLRNMAPVSVNDVLIATSEDEQHRPYLTITYTSP